ncbi:3-dehydroquinate synthase [Myxococcota bacterium]|nr:3-dehydroquinate synthase [Myxococcota bacterium]
MQLSRITVTLDYPIAFTRGVFKPGNRALTDVITRREPTKRHRTLFVVEHAVWSLWPGLGAELRVWAAENAASIELAAAPLVLAGGEPCKASMAEPLAVAEQLDAAKMDRHACVVIVGGGAFLDMVGFAAAITHRGVRTVRVPTTVLSQADSAVGVKNGINAFGKKNFLGTFAAPFGVVNDADLLETLPARDRIAGTSEAVKVALIRDRDFFEWIRSYAPALATGAQPVLSQLIQRSAELHVRHIATGGDPFELGTARPLDFGHWSAHKLESLSEFEIRHGEAVATGIALDSFYSVERGLLDPRSLEPIVHTLETLGFHLWHDELDARGTDGRPAILAGIQEFREHLGGELTLTMLAEPGRGVEIHELDEGIVLRALEWLRARARR